MNQTYTRKQAMQLLGIKSTNAFVHLTKKYSQMIIIIKAETSKHPRYDKAALDRFAERRELLREKLREKLRL